MGRLEKFVLGFVALCLLGGTWAFANYAMTQGGGTNFLSLTPGGVHMPQMAVCDPASPSQCTAVSVGGAASVTAAQATAANLNATVVQSTAANLNATVVNAGTFAVQAAISQSIPGISNKVVIGALPSAARNFPGCSVGTTATLCLAAVTAVNFLQVENTGTTNPIACSFSTTTPTLNSSTAFQLASGGAASWGPNTGGVPTGPLYCIAGTSTTPLFLEWN